MVASIHTPPAAWGVAARPPDPPVAARQHLEPGPVCSVLRTQFVEVRPLRRRWQVPISEHAYGCRVGHVVRGTPVRSRRGAAAGGWLCIAARAREAGRLGCEPQQILFGDRRARTSGTG